MQPRLDDDPSLVPDGWTLQPLGALCHILSGGTPLKADASFWQGDIPWVSGKDMKSPRLADTQDHISDAGLAAGSRLAPEGAVFLLVRGMGLAKDLPVAVAQRPMAFNQDIKALVPRTGLSGAFIRAAIYQSRARLLSRIVPSAHGTMTLNLDDVANFMVPVPLDTAEGNEVGRILDVVLEALDHATGQFLAARNLKRAGTRQLFTHGLRSEPQKESEIGLVPESWKVANLKSVREQLQYGTSTRCSVEPGAYPVLRIPNVESGRVNPLALKYCDLSAVEASKYLLSEDDLLFVRTNGVLERLGSCAVYTGNPKRALFASYLIRARLKPGVNPHYVAHFYGSARGTSLVAGRATPASDGKYNLNTGAIDALPLPLPPTFDEQHGIVAILDAIDNKIDLHRRKRTVLEDLFNALMHKLMTGEIRVTDLDLDALAPPTNAEPVVA